MGTSVQQINQKVSLVASQNTWIEGDAIQQLTKTAELQGMVRVVGMPDLHPGRGYPIGAAFFSQGHIYPALVGNDIGCGMALWQTDIKAAKLHLDKLAKQLNDVEAELDEDWATQIASLQAQHHLSRSEFDRALGTIGGGNHFAEFQAIDSVYQPDALHELGLDKKQLLLLVHSGSRGLGQSILTQHIQQFNHQGIATDTQALNQYLQQHDHAVRWAEVNRILIAQRFLAATRSQGQRVLDICHNLVSPAVIQGQSGWLHRKGATPSDQGYAVIPGSRGDYTYLVQPLASEVGLCSLAHGAGRKWRRSECQGRLSHKFKREDLLRTTLGSRVICNHKALLYEEAPQAYKTCSSVIADLVDAGLIRCVARLRPVLTFKTQGGCSE